MTQNFNPSASGGGAVAGGAAQGGAVAGGAVAGGAPKGGAVAGQPGPAESPGQPGPAESPGQPGPAESPGQATPPSGPARADDAAQARDALARIQREVRKAVVGQDQAVTALLIGLLTRGHVLLEGVPGTAKTLLIRALARSLDLETQRIQFTPDLMPGDVTGSLIYDRAAGDFNFRPGPVFTNLLLADEINRTPPKTQSALLEAMAERQVSVDRKTHALPSPFLVAATQNPVESEGTYPLPEAQLDRFTMKVIVNLPNRADEVEIVHRHARGFDATDLESAGIQPVAGAADIEAGIGAVKAVTITEDVAGYIVDIARATRSAPSLRFGMSPRAATALLATSRAWAWLSGRDFVTPDDVKMMTPATIAHRLGLRPEAELEGISTYSVLQSALDSVPVPR